MRKLARYPILWLLAVLACTLLTSSFTTAHAGTVDAYYQFRDYTDSPLNVRRVVITPIGPSGEYSGSFLSQKPINYSYATYPSLTNGYLLATNLITGYAYRVAFSDGFGEPTVTNYFGTNLSGTVGAVTNKTSYIQWVNGVAIQINGPYFNATITNTTTAGGSATNVTLRAGTGVAVTTNSSSDWTVTASEVPYTALTAAARLNITNAAEKAAMDATNGFTAGSGASVNATNLAQATTNGSVVTINVSTQAVVKVMQNNGVVTNGSSATLSGITAASPFNIDLLGGSFTSGNSTLGASGLTVTGGGSFSPSGFDGSGANLTNIPYAGLSQSARESITNAAGGGVSPAQVSAIIQTNQTTYNILDYGALTNAHKALQICLDKAGTNNGGGNVCFIPEGDWYITNSSFYPTLSSENLESMLVIIGTNTIVRGVGPSSKIIVDLGTLASRNVFGSGDSIASGGGRVNWQGDQNITFENFTIDSQQNGGDQTQFYGGRSYKFLNVTSRNSGADFIDTESVTTTAIGCYVTNAIGSAFQTKASTSETAHGIIADCWFEDSSSAATAPTIQVLNNVSILCSNTKIGGAKNIYTLGTFAGGQFSFDNCYFYPTNGGQAPLILVGVVGGFTDCIFYGNGSTTSSNYIYATNCNLQIANSTFYSKDGIWAHDVKASIVGSRFVNGAGSAITMRGNSSSPWGSSVLGCSFAGGSASAFDNAASFVRFEGNTSTDRNVLITGGTNSVIANNTMLGTASTRITSANFNEIRDNIMPVNSASVHSIMLTGANSNRISGNNLGKLTLNTGCYGNELIGNRIEHYAYIGGAAESMLNSGTRRNNATSTNTWWPESNWDGQYATNIQSTNIVGLQSSVFPTNSIPLGSATVTNIGFVSWRGYLVTVATNRAAGGWMWQTNGPSGAPVWGAFNPASQP